MKKKPPIKTRTLSLCPICHKPIDVISCSNTYTHYKCEAKLIIQQIAREVLQEDFQRMIQEIWE